MLFEQLSGYLAVHNIDSFNKLQDKYPVPGKEYMKKHLELIEGIEISIELETSEHAQEMLEKIHLEFEKKTTKKD